jgi:uncharacterized SAM-binding protein YcdF (DUF218 family)
MRKLISCLGAFLALAVALFLALPRLLLATDPLPAHADAVLVFAGQVPDRARCAAEMVQRGVAPVAVFTGQSVKPELAAVGLPLPDAALNARIATDAGLPPGAQRVLPIGTSTWEEASAMRQWITEQHARGVIAVTSPTHSRRARRVLRMALAPLGVEVAMYACGPVHTLREGWWREEKPLIEVSNEAIKLVLYGFRFFLPTALGLTSPP